MRQIPREAAGCGLDHPPRLAEIRESRGVLGGAPPKLRARAFSLTRDHSASAGTADARAAAMPRTAAS